MAKGLTYKSSGVDVNKAEYFVKSIKALTLGTKNSSVLNNPGAFGSLFAFNNQKYKNPVLVSSTDGVGTKILLAGHLNKHDTVGIDLVAMNVNDILCTGAKPLFFLDYIACGKLKPLVLKDVVRGIIAGCERAGCSLIGGETAEMPGMYKDNDYDLAGFAVGVVDKAKMIDGSAIKKGDRLLGIASSGLHSNGYSLARKVFSAGEQKKYAEELLEPTRIYVQPVLKVLEKIRVKGMAHITGGAFYQKLTKIAPKGTCFSVNKKAWEVPELFKKIQSKGKITDKEMFTTFNMGIGMVLVISGEDIKKTQAILKRWSLPCWDIGEVVLDKKRRIIL